MGSFGEKLRRERELRAVTLDEIAEATKIGTRSLKALEDEQFDILPGGIFNKGFVRAYAKYLGIDEEQAVADYVDAVAKATGATEAPTDEAVVASIAKKRSEPEKPIGVGDGSSKVWVTLALVALVAAGGYSSWKYYEQRKAEQELAAAATMQTQTAPVVTPPAPVEAQPTSTDAVPASAQDTDAAQSVSVPTNEPSVNAPAKDTIAPTLKAVEGKFTITLHTNEEAWVSVQADGKTVLESLLQPNADRTISAKDRIVMKVGKPGAVAVLFNGAPVGPLGPPDKTVTKTFTSEGMQQ